MIKAHLQIDRTAFGSSAFRNHYDIATEEDLEQFAYTVLHNFQYKDTPIKTVTIEVDNSRSTFKQEDYPELSNLFYNLAWLQ